MNNEETKRHQWRNNSKSRYQNPDVKEKKRIYMKEQYQKKKMKLKPKIKTAIKMMKNFEKK